METKIPIAEITRVLNEVPPGADDQRATGLETLLNLRAAQAVQMRRELTRFTALAGADDPYVVRLQQQISVNDDFMAGVKRAIEQARSDGPKSDPNLWVVTGHVLDASGRPLSKVNVTFGDDKGTPQGQMASADTDDKGAFILRQPVAGITLTAVRLVLRDANKKVVFIDTAKLVPAGGSTISREITFSVSTGGAGPPVSTPIPKKAADDKASPNLKSKTPPKTKPDDEKPE
jgi:hypothetical protein